jgi:hypothetical protein
MLRGAIPDELGKKGPVTDADDETILVSWTL